MPLGCIKRLMCWVAKWVKCRSSIWASRLGAIRVGYYFGSMLLIELNLNYYYYFFFWGGDEYKRKISWNGWNSLCLRKEYGGMGVRRLRKFNIALLGKWCWRLLVDREGLLRKVLVARYVVEDGGRSCSSCFCLVQLSARCGS